MRINLALVLTEATNLLNAIEAKSWHHAVNAAHACLSAMPSPAWAEETPGYANYSPGEIEATDLCNRLRMVVMQWMAILSDPRSSRSWEKNDDWPDPKSLRAILRETGMPG